MALNSAVTKAQIVFLYIQVARGSHFGASQHTVHRRTNVIMTNGWSGDLRPPQPDVSVIWAQKCYQRHKSAWNMKQHLQIAYLSLVQSRRFCVNVNKYLFKTKLSSFFGISNLCSASPYFDPRGKHYFFCICSIQLCPTWRAPSLSCFPTPNTSMSAADMALQ